MEYSGSLTKAQRGRLRDLKRELGSVRGAAVAANLPYGKVRRYFEHLASIEGKGEARVHTEIPGFRAVVFDLETTSLDTFFGRLIVACFLDLNTQELEVRTIDDYQGSDDERELALLDWTLSRIEGADVLIGHNITGFDHHYLNGRLAALGDYRLVPARLHVDTYQVARNGFKGRTHGYSLENLADFFRLPVQKDKPSKHEWARSRELEDNAISRIAVRCVEDVKVNAYLWGKLRPYWYRWRGRQ